MRYFFLFLLIFCLVIPLSSAQIPDDYDEFIQGTEMSVGVTTNAPETSSVFNYSYTENLEVQMDIFIPDLPDSVASSIGINLRASVLGDSTEISYSLTTTHFSTFFQAYLETITIGQERVLPESQNISRQVVSLKQSQERYTITLGIRGEYGEFQPQQVSVPLDLVFTGFFPVVYDTGGFDYNTWTDNFLPLAVVDTLILPVAAAGATLHLIKSSFSLAGKKIDQVQDLVGENEEVVNTVRATKEAVDFATDVAVIKQDLEEDQSWMTVWGKLSLVIFILLLISSALSQSIGSFLSLQTSQIDLISLIFTYYTAFYSLLLFVIAMISLLRPTVLSKFGSKIPIVHVIFIILSVLIFVLLPFVILYPLLDLGSISLIRDLLLLSTISMGFILTTLFAGYFLARSGESWSELFGNLMKKIKFPRGIIKVVLRLFTLGFLFILLIRLAKTLALIFTVLVESQLSQNAYLISLAASYLRDEMTDSIWIAYGLLLIFFIQAIMEVYLHIRKEDLIDKKEMISVYRAYRRLALFLGVTMLSFLYLVVFLEGRLEELGIASLVYPQPAVDTLDVFNLIFITPAFKILLDIMLALGLALALPFVLTGMWKKSSNLPHDLNKGDTKKKEELSDHTAEVTSSDTEELQTEK